MNATPETPGVMPRRVDSPEPTGKPFVEHLQDLRAALIWCVACYVVAACACFPLVPWMLRILKEPLVWAGLNPGELLRVFRITDGFAVAMRAVAWGGLVIAAPFILGGIAWFVFPGLRQLERHRVLQLGGVCAVLFVAGAVLAYRWIMPLGLRWLIQINQWVGVPCTFIELDSYLRFLLQGLAGFGLAFQTPVVIVGLGWLGILTAAQLRRTRRHAIVVLMTLAAVLTPPDPWSMVLLSVPLIALYELCIWVVTLFERRQLNGLGICCSQRDAEPDS